MRLASRMSLASRMKWHIPRLSGFITVLLLAVGGLNKRGSERARARLPSQAEDQAELAAANARLHVAKAEAKAEHLEAALGGMADAVLGDRMRGVDRALDVRLVAIFDPEIVRFQVDVQVWQDQLVLDEALNDTRRLIPVELNDRGLDLDLCHHGSLVAASRLMPAARPSDRHGHSHRGGFRASYRGTVSDGPAASPRAIVSATPSKSVTVLVGELL
jgi:hypothetical protein